MIYARIKLDSTVDRSLTNKLIDYIETDIPCIYADWSIDQTDIKLTIPDTESLEELEGLLKVLFHGINVLQMDVSMDHIDKSIEAKYNYRFIIMDSSDSPIKQQLIKLFPAASILN